MKKADFTPAVWAQVKNEAYQAITARAQMRGMITYGELAQKITVIKFDFEDPSHRDTIGWLLGELSRDEVAQGRGLITALVVHKRDDMEPGRGFFELANELGYDTSDYTVCWANCVKEVHKVWSV